MKQEGDAPKKSLDHAYFVFVAFPVHHLAITQEEYQKLAFELELPVRMFKI